MVNRNKDILYRPYEELRRLQDRKLRLFLTRYLYPFSPHYRRLFNRHKINPAGIKSVDDLKRIPFTSKDDFLGSSRRKSANGNIDGSTSLTVNPEQSRRIDFLLQPSEELVRKYLPKGEQAKILLLKLLRGKDYIRNRLEKEFRPIFLTATAGTTNQPTPFLYTSYDLDNLKLYGKRIIEIYDIKPGERGVNVFPYAPHLAFWQVVFAGISGNVFILSTGGGKILGTDGNIRNILKVRPRFLIGEAGYVYHILKVAYEQNLRLDFLNFIILGASRIPKGFKKKISGLLDRMGASSVKIAGTYGFTESRCAWTECPTDIDVSSGYHTYPDREVFEVIDPKTGEVKKEGEDGEIVYSNIDARGTCVLRFRTGDLVNGGIVYSPCPYCKRTVPRISSSISRSSNIKKIRLSKIKGVLVNLNNLEHLLDDKEEIDQWQIEIAKKDNDPYEVDELNLYVCLLESSNRKEFLECLKREVLCDTEVSFNKIHCISREEIRKRIGVESELKAKKIVDKRQK